MDTQLKENKLENSQIDKVPLTVVVIAKNEQDHIGECLKSVNEWADEIIVVDDESTDETVSLANQFASKVFTRKMTNEGAHRNWAYAQARNAWVLSLDADEVVSDELREEIREKLKNIECEALAIPIKTYIGDYWVKYSGWYPANKMRMFLKDKQKYEEVEVHPKPMYQIKTENLTKDIIHRGYPDLAHFMASVNRQTTLEARKWIQTDRKMSFGHALLRTLDRFPRSYFRKRGYKDGYIGFVIATFASLYQFLSYAKYREMLGAKGKV